MSVAMALPLPPAAEEESKLAGMVASPLRADLIIQRQLFRGNEYYVIKDPLTLTYYRLQHDEGFLVTLLDGKRTYGEIHRLFLAQFPNKELTLRELALFVNQISGGGLLNINARKFVGIARQKESVAGGWLMLWGKVLSGLLFMRFPLVDPSPWLGKLSHAIRFVWTRWFIGLCLGFVSWTVFWLIVNRDAFSQNTINFFTPENLFLVWVTIIIVKTIHEFGHATTCRHFGAEVHEMGVCLMCFAPAGYVDASDAWMMRKKAHKLYTTIAGIFAEFVIASIAAHLWLYLPPGLAKNLAFNAMIVASVNTVFFNANPLMKFDGYYLVSDLIEIPNLRAKAMVYCSYHVQRWLLGYRNLAQERVLQDEQHNRVFIVYSILAYLYMGTVIYSLSQVFARFLAPYGLYDFGLALGIFVEGSFLMFPIVKVLLDAFSSNRADMVRETNVWRRIVTWLVPFIGVIILLTYVPGNFEVVQQGLIEPVKGERAGVEVGGTVEKVHARFGEWVEAGQPLLTLRNEDVTNETRVAELSYLTAKLRLTSLQVNGTMRAAALSPDAALAVESAVTARDRYARAEAQLVVRAPTSGYVVTRDLDRLIGQYLPAGFSGLRVADLRKYKLVIPLTEQQADLVEIGSPVRGRAIADGSLVVGRISSLPSQRATWPDYRSAMLSAFGGPAPYEMVSAVDGSPPKFAIYVAEAELTQQPAGVTEGLRVKLTITGRRATYGQRVWRWFVGLWRISPSA